MLSRLTSTAVMSRRAEPADSLDYFPTPPWGTRAFCEHVLPAVWGRFPDLYDATVADPACGEGHMAGALADYFPEVLAADIHPYGFGGVADFLHPDWEERAVMPLLGNRRLDWIVTNPPFNLAAQFIDQALTVAWRGCAMLVRSNFAEGQGRYRELFSRRPPQLVAQFVERLPMHKGRWVVNGKSATAYSWFVWLKIKGAEWNHTRMMWIPPCEAALTRHDDWQRFGGCMDLPATHPAMNVPRDFALPTLQVAAAMDALRGELGALL